MFLGLILAENQGQCVGKTHRFSRFKIVDAPVLHQGPNPGPIWGPRCCIPVLTRALLAVHLQVSLQVSASVTC